MPSITPRLCLCACIAFAILVIVVQTPGYAFVEVGGASAVDDRDWPKGTVEVANLPSRFRYTEGWGPTTFEYRGDAQALNEALQRFAEIRAPKLELAIHDGAGARQAAPSEEAGPVNWSFTVWSPRSYFQSAQSDVRGRYNAQAIPVLPIRPATVPPPHMDVYTEGINWDEVKIPDGLVVTDERGGKRAATPAQTGVLSGAVYDVATGKPIAGATVSAVANTRDTTPANLGPVTTDENGDFRIEYNGPSHYYVTVQAEGYVSRKAGNYFDDVYTHTFVGSGLDKVAAYMSKAASAAGRVTDPEGKPVVGAKVHARNPIGINGELYPLVEKTAPVETDSEGRFRIEGLPEGVVYLLCSGEWDTNTVFDLFPVPAANVHLIAVRTVSLKGRLVDASGDPASGEVDLRAAADRIGRFATSARVGDDGAFEMLSVPPGEYTLSAGGSRYWNEQDPTAQNVVLKPGETVQATLSAPPPEDEQRENQEEMVLVGKPAPAPDAAEWVNDQAANLDVLRGKPVVLVFWNSTIPSSEKVVALVKQIAEKHPSVATVLVHTAGADKGVLQESAASAGLKCPIAVDKPSSGQFPGATFEKYHVKKPPAVYILDGNGIVQFQDLSFDAVDQALATLAAAG